MDITSLKSGFWGYKKSSVCEYIAVVNEEFSNRLIDTLRDYDRQIRELHIRISQLEAENAVFRRERDNAAKVMVNARAYSDDVRIQAEAEGERIRENNREYHQKQLNQIEEFSKSIDNVLGDIRCLLSCVDKDLSESEQKLQTLKDGLGNTSKSTEEEQAHEPV